MKDSAIILLGLFLVLAIGVWSFFRSEKGASKEIPPQSASEEAVTFQKISLEELRDIVLERKKSEETILLDIRPSSLWAEEHIIGSKNLMYEDASQSLQPTDAEKTKHWILVSPDTSLAGRFVTLLREREIPDERIRVFDGTYETWKEKTGLVIRRADPSSPIDVTKIRLVTPEEAKKKIEEGGKWFILDTRSPEWFAKDHIAGAINIPFPTIEENRKTIPSTANIFVYGDTDREGFAAGVLLFDLGFFNTYTLSSSFDDWKARDFPTENTRK